MRGGARIDGSGWCGVVMGGDFFGGGGWGWSAKRRAWSGATASGATASSELRCNGERRRNGADNGAGAKGWQYAYRRHVLSGA